ncbi:NAD(P)-dependent oxidoreductase [Lewinella sp. W8]|uniref:NAD(P)-dependent oxidoreductase n=1 Tax=Lewinella sp. W8 TaxID=2528208 RepID=UPI0010684F93|nr:NAD(P)-binding oxidoreductase [Lewinella sp. W8]MTB49768.1 NAD(P)H-binding protein [Lewinella sp. W8]
MSKTVLVFGANGNLGSHFVKQALDAGYRIRAFVRTPEKYYLSDNVNIEVFKGDATNYDDVEKAVSGVDIVVSCLGNPPKKKIYIMDKAYENIMLAASDQPNTPRCLMISSIGIGGSSWFVKFLLQQIGGKEGFADFEKAEKRVLEAKDVPFVAIRPAGLTNKQGKGKYRIIEKPTVFFPKFISRSDVAKFFVHCLNDTSFDRRAVMIEGA